MSPMLRHRVATPVATVVPVVMRAVALVAAVVVAVTAPVEEGKENPALVIAAVMVVVPVDQKAVPNNLNFHAH